MLQNAITSPIRNVAYCALAAPKAARDIDSYALFGHGGVHTRAYTHVSGICIRDYTSRVDRIAVRAAGSESSRTYIFMYLSRTPFVFTCRPISPRIISRRRFCDRNYEVRHLPHTLPATVFRSNFDVYTFDTSQIHITYRLRAIFIHVQFFSLAAHNVILTAIFCEL